MTLTHLPCVTLQEPWATLVTLRYKTIITRRTNHYHTLWGKRIGIHAGNRWDPTWKETIKPVVRPEEFSEIVKQVNAINMDFRPALLAIAYADRPPGGISRYKYLKKEHNKSALMVCHDRQYCGMHLWRIEPIIPIPMRGKLGIWHTDLELPEEVKRPSNRITTS